MCYQMAANKCYWLLDFLSPSSGKPWKLHLKTILWVHRERGKGNNLLLASTSQSVCYTKH